MGQGSLKRGLLVAIPLLGLARSARADEEPKVEEVKVGGARTEAERLQQSADAVNVVDTRKAKEQSADLGEVLARTQGVNVRRDGGLGSNARFALNGIYDRIPFFLDGVPLELAGYPFGIANVPVNLVDRVEVYRGVIPIRFGIDGIGGAVNLVGDQRYDTHAAASYQAGSFGTQRATLSGRWRHEPTSFMLGVATFFDAARNNYDVEVEIPDRRGRPIPTTISRFNDGYWACGLNVEGGFVDKPWARKLMVKPFFSVFDKELQHNALMTAPYGGVSYGERVWGATATHEVALGPELDMETIATYSHRTIWLDDRSTSLYDWNGRKVGTRRIPGEIDGTPYDQEAWQQSIFARVRFEWSILPKTHVLRAAVTPNYTTRTGENRARVSLGARDPMSAERELVTLVSGLEYELTMFRERLENIAFLKDYYYWASTEEPLPGNVSFRRADSDRHRQGLGDGLRLRFTPWLYAKASYEYATRLPRPDEIFGDAVLVQPSLLLQPEISHNGNLGSRVELRRTPVGDITVDVNVFLRESDRLIVLLGGNNRFKNENVYAARAQGFESAVEWQSPGRWLALNGMLTWQDVRNRSTEGTFGDFEGDRIPNRPYLFGSWGARLRLPGLLSELDKIEPYYIGRFVEGFFRGWESQGLRAFKQTVDSQLTHAVGLSWIVNRPEARSSATFEIDNLTDARVFDNFGVQRPGRAAYIKMTVEL